MSITAGGVGSWQNRFFVKFYFWAARFFRGFYRWMNAAQFCGEKSPEKSSRKSPANPPKFIQKIPDTSLQRRRAQKSSFPEDEGSQDCFKIVKRTLRELFS